VIVGAGASYACGPDGEHERPPLTRQLFDRRGAARELLKTYSLARVAGGRIQREMQADTTLAFEEALLNLRTAENGHRRQMSLAIPPYLQALLMSYSTSLQAEAKRYEVLVDELLDLPSSVCFVSLNYDTLLDNCLGAFSPLNDLGDYIDTPLGWSLIKPHGSVNWYVEQPVAFDPTAPEQLDVREAPIECVPAKSLDLGEVRGIPVLSGHRPHARTRRYPAIALPEGPKDRLVLPPEHLRHLRNLLSAAQQIDLLVLGYSAIDTEILELIKSSVGRIRRMTVVNADPVATLAVHAKIVDFGITAIWSDTFDGSYEQWIDGDGLHRWVQEFGGLPSTVPGSPYPSRVSPDELEQRVAGRAFEARFTDVSHPR
jgi:hypothetical protein